MSTPRLENLSRLLVEERSPHNKAHAHRPPKSDCLLCDFLPLRQEKTDLPVDTTCLTISTARFTPPAL
ncbi:MAG: hypothetical protein ICV63_04480 [Coleofasciculus sp. Co-bin14]|nr:hypothetical protein [Coleofasciculus sp. Co-bin14]